jgi:hypothetical protein
MDILHQGSKMSLRSRESEFVKKDLWRASAEGHPSDRATVDADTLAQKSTENHPGPKVALDPSRSKPHKFNAQSFIKYSRVADYLRLSSRR